MTYTSEPPTVPGDYHAIDLDDMFIIKLEVDGTFRVEGQNISRKECAFLGYEFGPRIPSPEEIEAMEELRVACAELDPHFIYRATTGGLEWRAMSSALAKLDAIRGESK